MSCVGATQLSGGPGTQLEAWDSPEEAGWLDKKLIMWLNININDEYYYSSSVFLPASPRSSEIG